MVINRDIPVVYYLNRGTWLFGLWGLVSKPYCLTEMR